MRFDGEQGALSSEPAGIAVEAHRQGLPEIPWVRHRMARESASGGWETGTIIGAKMKGT